MKHQVDSIQLGTRDLIKRSIDKCTSRLFTLFADELDNVKKVFNNFRRSPPLVHNWPKYAGAAMWARTLKQQIDYPKAALDAATFLILGDSEQKV